LISQHFQNKFHVLGHWRREFPIISTLGVNKPEGPGMKHLPFNPAQHFGFLGEPLFPPASPMAVNRISHNGIPDVGKMNADLMGSSCFR
jgi:hypothetical protein